MDEKLQQIMDAIQSSKREMQQELSSKLEKLQKEVTSGQESASQEVVKRIEKRSYQFCRKGNKEQFRFNASVEEHIEAAKEELGKLAPIDEGQKGIVQRTAQHLDEGTKVLAVQQKHIRIADRSDLGWAVVQGYMDDELASDSDDERKLFKASREAQQTVKRKRAESAAAAATKRRKYQVMQVGNHRLKLAQAKDLIMGSGQQQRDHGWWGLVTGVVSWGIWWPTAPSLDNSILLNSLW